jgi:hypothetical protein
MAAAHAPTLWIIGDDPRVHALTQSLERHGVTVLVSSTLSADASHHHGAAPAAVLAAHAATEQLEATLRRWHSLSMYRHVPFLALGDHDALGIRMQLFLQGAAGSFSWSPSIDATAQTVLNALNELHRLGAQQALPMGDTTSEALLDFCRGSLREGLFQRAGVINQPQVTLDIRLGDGSQVARTVAGFVERLNSMVVHSSVADDPMLDTPDPVVSWSDEKEWDGLASLHNTRIALLMNSAGKADRLACELRAAGATVMVSSSDEADLQRLCEMDPEILLIDTSEIRDSNIDVLPRVRQDPRLRWAAAVMVRNEDFQEHGIAEIHRLARQIRSLLDDDRRLVAELHATPVYTSVQSHGPNKLLRLLESHDGVLSVQVQSVDGQAAVEMTEGLVISATWSDDTGHRRLGGVDALARFLSLREGSVTIDRVQLPHAANLIMPLDQALDQALSTSYEAPAATTAGGSTSQPTPAEWPRDELSFLDPKSGTVRVLKPRPEYTASLEHHKVARDSTRDVRMSSYIRTSGDAHAETAQPAEAMGGALPLDLAVGMEHHGLLDATHDMRGATQRAPLRLAHTTTLEPQDQFPNKFPGKFPGKFLDTLGGEFAAFEARPHTVHATGATDRLSSGDEHGSDLLFLDEPDLELRSEEKTPIKTLPPEVMHRLHHVEPPVTSASNSASNWTSNSGPTTTLVMAHPASALHDSNFAVPAIDSPAIDTHTIDSSSIDMPAFDSLLQSSPAHEITEMQWFKESPRRFSGPASNDTAPFELSEPFEDWEPIGSPLFAARGPRTQHVRRIGPGWAWAAALLAAGLIVGSLWVAAIQ